MESPHNMPAAADYAWATAVKAHRTQETQDRSIADLTNRVDALERQVLFLGLRATGQGDPAEAAEILPRPASQPQTTAQTVWVVCWFGYDSPDTPYGIFTSLGAAQQSREGATWEGPDEDGEYITADADACANRGYRIVPMELSD